MLILLLILSLISLLRYCCCCCFMFAIELVDDVVSVRADVAVVDVVDGHVVVELLLTLV